MKQQIERKLQPMLNRHWMYGTRVITITGYEISDEKQKVFIHTNERENHFERPYEAINELLKQLTAATPETKEKQSDMMVIGANNVAQQLKGILLDNIEKVKADKGYIPQATVICNNVNSLINLTKMELDYVKTAHKFKEHGE